MKLLIVFMSVFFMFNSAKASDYSEGQVWSYKTRPGEENSTLRINKIETHAKLGNIYHISVEGVKVNNPAIDSGVTTELPHFPVSEETLKKSLKKLIDNSAPNPEYIEGYNSWKVEFDNGNAGIFTIPIDEIVGIIEQAINRQ